MWAWTVVRKRAIQYLSVILHKNSLLSVLDCLLSTSCLHLRSLHIASRATDLEHVCSLEAVLPENCCPTLSELSSDKTNDIYTHLIFQDTASLSVGLSGLCSDKTIDIYTQLIFQDTASISLPGLCLSEFIITMIFPSYEMKQESIHGPKFICYWNVSPKRAAAKTNSKSF
jgi:hypothetical protein